MRSRRLLPLALLAAVASSSLAQHPAGGGAHSFAAPRAASPPGLSSTLPMGSPPFADFSGIRQMGSGHHFPASLPFGLGFLSDFSLPAQPTDAPAQPSINWIEALAALNKTPEPPPPASQPLLIELQGDRYVRIANPEMTEGLHDIPAQNGNGSRPRKLANSLAVGKPSTQSPTSTTAAITELPPAVLVFRDGHSESIRDYSIVAGVIYARGDYYTDGYWNKKIELTALNLPETFKSNESRGVRFVLPNAPNEVITRP